MMNQPLDAHWFRRGIDSGGFHRHLAIHAPWNVPAVAAMARGALGRLRRPDLPVLFRHSTGTFQRPSAAAGTAASRVDPAVRLVHSFVRHHPPPRHRDAVGADLSFSRGRQTRHRAGLDDDGHRAVQARADLGQPTLAARSRRRQSEAPRGNSGSRGNPRLAPAGAGLARNAGRGPHCGAEGKQWPIGRNRAGGGSSQQKPAVRGLFPRSAKRPRHGTNR